MDKIEQQINKMQKTLIKYGVKMKDPKTKVLVEEIRRYAVPPAGFVRYVYELRGATFHVNSIYFPGLVAKYAEFCREAEFNVRNRVVSSLRGFENKKSYLAIEDLLAPPRHDMCNIIRWCLAKRNNVKTTSPELLLKAVQEDLACSPWFMTCADLLPELKEVGEWL